MDQSAILAYEIRAYVDEPNAIYLELFGCCVELLTGQDKLVLSGIRLARSKASIS